MMSQSEVPPCSHTTKCTLKQYGTQQTPTPSSVITIQASTLPGLLHITALTGNKLNRSVEEWQAWTYHSKKSWRKPYSRMKALPLVPYCINQRNKHPFSFLPSPTVCTWTHSQHPKKAALPWTLNNTVRLKCKQHLRKHSDMQSAPTYKAQKNYLKWINLEYENGN